MSNIGIDYGFSRTNIDTATRIRYGVISQHSVGQVLYDAQEFDYPETDDEDAYAEPVGWHVSEEGYEIVDCLDNDAMILKSPYYTFARYCSPCVPGAGNLDDADPNGVKTYCLGHDWFEDGKAPYPVFRVDTNELVEGGG